MKNYAKYKAIDFIQDGCFVQWVKSGGKQHHLFWEKWQKSQPDRLEELQVAKLFLERIKYANQHDLSPDQADQLHDDIILHAGRVSDNLANHPRRIWSGSIWYSAAAILFLCVFTAILYQFRPVNNHKTIEVPEFIIKQTPRGAMMSVMLPDGTEVKLNANSRIRFPASFDGNERMVHLNGEAYFKVKRDPTQPFTILSENLETTVLGTEFNIKVYPDEAVNKIAVSEGMVKVSHANNEPIILKQDEMVTLNLQQGRLQRSLFNAKEETGWKDGILYFRELPLSEVFSRLEVYFDVSIHAASNIRLNDRYTGEFNQESLTNILEGIAFTSGIRYRMEVKNIYLY